MPTLFELVCYGMLHLYAAQIIVVNIVFIFSDNAIDSKASYFAAMLPWFLIMPILVIYKLTQIPDK